MAKRLAVVLVVVMMASLAMAQKPSPVTRVDLHEQKSAAESNDAAQLPLTSLPAGTAVKMKLETMISSTASRPGDSFSGRVTEDVNLNGKTVIPVGASVQGTVTAVNEPRRYKGRPSINMRPDQITMPNGDKYSVNLMVVQTAAGTRTNVDKEGKITGPGHERRDTYELAIGAGAGTAVGAGLKGGKGALIGATIGGGAAIVHWMTKRYQAVLPAGTEVVMELSRPMAISASSSGQ